jgi:3-oxoacyl-[acyl-carrier protein] reductase
MTSSPDFANCWFWICGATSGIGYAVAEDLASRGASLVLMARNKENLQVAATKLKQAGAAEIILAPLDITHPDTPSRAAGLIEKLTLAGILLNGGGPPGLRAGSIKAADMVSAHSLLLLGPVLLLEALLPKLQTPGASVVAITSTTVKQVNPDLVLSAAYRSALVAYLKHLSDEVGPRGIRINNVAPGFTETERLNELGQHIAKASQNKNTVEALEQVRQKWRESASLKRMAQPKEIASVCRFLFSNEASFITGQTIVADGGQIQTY